MIDDKSRSEMAETATKTLRNGLRCVMGLF